MGYDTTRYGSAGLPLRLRGRKKRKEGSGGGWRRWRTGDVIIMLLQISVDGNMTTSVLSFMATKADAGRHLSCQAENRIMGTAPIEDGWVLQIQCKLINAARASAPTRGRSAPPTLFPYLFRRAAIRSILTVYPKVVIRRHAGDADPARHVAQPEHDTRGHGRLLRLPHTGRAAGLQGRVAAPGKSESALFL